jgi:hypothetical protein
MLKHLETALSVVCLIMCGVALYQNDWSRAIFFYLVHMNSEIRSQAKTLKN